MLYDTNEEDGEERVEEAEEVEKEKKRNAIPGFLLTVYFILKETHFWNSLN